LPETVKRLQLVDETTKKYGCQKLTIFTFIALSLLMATGRASGLQKQRLVKGCHLKGSVSVDPAPPEVMAEN